MAKRFKLQINLINKFKSKCCEIEERIRKIKERRIVLLTHVDVSIYGYKLDFSSRNIISYYISHI